MQTGSVACALLAAAVPADAGSPLPPLLRAAVEHHLLAQAAGLPGQVTVQLADPAGGGLPPCADPQPFLPQGVLPWGRISVGVRCAGERPWTRFLFADVQVRGGYLVASRAIGAGELLQPGDVELRTADLTKLPRSVLADPAQVSGRLAINVIAAGAPLRAELLRGALVVHQGDTVRLTAQGLGFVASTEARAVTSAAAGATVQVKTAQGRLLSGTAGPDGTVELSR